MKSHEGWEDFMRFQNHEIWEVSLCLGNRCSSLPPISNITELRRLRVFAGPLLLLSGRTLYIVGFLEHPDKCVYLSVTPHSPGWEGSQHTKFLCLSQLPVFQQIKASKGKKKKNAVDSVPPPVPILIWVRKSRQTSAQWLITHYVALT